MIACCIACWLGGLKEGKNIASAGNRTRINCLEGSYADHYTTDAVLILLLLNGAAKINWRVSLALYVTSISAG